MPDLPTRPARAVFVNRFYWPEEPATAQLLTDLAEQLAKRGHEILVVTRHPENAGVPRREIRNGVEIVRVRSTNWHRSGLAGKAADYAMFFAGAIFRLLVLLRRGDALIALTDPPLLGIGAWMAARWRGARLFHWVQDIYPELAIELAGQRWLRATRPLRNRAWRAAEHIVVPGHDMAAVLTSARMPGVRVSIVPNWAPVGLGPQAPDAGDTLRTEWGLSGKFVVAYSGNLGRVHDLEPVLVVAEALRDEPGIAFVFIGSGAQAATLMAEARQRKLDNVSFRPAQTRAQLGPTLALGDVHLVTLRPGCARYVFPSKLYGIAAVGRPILFIGPRGCELARLVAEHGFGGSFESGEIAALVAALRKLHTDAAARERCGRAVAQWHRTQGGLAAAGERWHALLGSTRELAGKLPHA